MKPSWWYKKYGADYPQTKEEFMLKIIDNNEEERLIAEDLLKEGVKWEQLIVKE